MLALSFSVEFTITLIFSPKEVIELFTAIIGLCTVGIPILFARNKKKRKGHNKKNKH